MNTIKFDKVYINDAYTFFGRNEYNPTIISNVDKVINDYYNKEKSLELAEASFQRESVKGLLTKLSLSQDEIDLLIGGDLQNQLLATSFNAKNFNMPLLGVYSACATFVEGLIIASTLIDGKKINKSIVVSSSHNLASEKQFRFPIEYGSIRKKVNTFTATGSVSALLSSDKGKFKIESATIGKVIDLNYKDANNFGACMAPSAAETIYEHLKNTDQNSNDYDLILTGDLGVYGVEILKEYLNKKYKIKLNNIKDAGSVLFDTKVNSKIAGGSGPFCLPLILFTKIKKNKYKKVLIVGTGSLHSSISCAQQESIPSISHAVSLEVLS